MPGEKILGKSFRAFELCSSFARTEDIQAILGEHVDDAINQCRFRADDSQSDIIGAGEFE